MIDSVLVSLTLAAQDAAGAGADGATAPAAAAESFFVSGRGALFGWLVVISVFVLVSIMKARAGKVFKVRPIAGLSAVDEAVGRATEMGRPVLFIPGIQDMDNVQTIAGLTILSRVGKTTADYDAHIEVPVSRSLVMTAGREALSASYLAAGRPDSFNEDQVYYVTDEQFGYTAYVSGLMVRKKPAACFYMGQFFAESLILAETGNSIGAIQIAGTAETSQLPFFVAACDYTLIGEEFFAASAYLSGEPDQMGSLRGQDLSKALVGAVLVLGVVVMTVGALAGGLVDLGSVSRFFQSLVGG
ncbi:MAG: hypothetical protein O2819_04815 [Planctomycetota bacterium]|nr:hypothetical protein [Planctomycetota bacterium]